MRSKKSYKLNTLSSYFRFVTFAFATCKEKANGARAEEKRRQDVLWLETNDKRTEKCAPVRSAPRTHLRTAQNQLITTFFTSEVFKRSMVKLLQFDKKKKNVEQKTLLCLRSCVLKMESPF